MLNREFCSTTPCINPNNVNTKYFQVLTLTSMLEQLLVIPFPENVEMIFKTYRTKLRRLSE